MRLLRIELGTSGGETSPAAAPTSVHVGCLPGGLELRLEDGVTRKSMRRVLPDTPLRGPDGARLLALAVAEFVVASWTELSVVPEPAVQPVGPAPPPEAQARARRAVALRQRVAPPAAQAAWHWGLEAGLSGVPVHMRGSLASGALRGGYRRGPLILRLVLEGAYGVEPVDPGRLRLGLVGLRPELLIVGRFGQMEAEVGVGGRVASIFATGQSVDAGRFSGRIERAPIAALLSTVAGYYAPQPLLRVGLRGEAGWVTWPVEFQAEGTGTVLEVAGLWLGVSLVADFAP